MHCEVGAILYDALRAVSQSLLEQDARYQKLVTIVESLADVPVTTCAEKFAAEMTSEVLFPLADRCLPESQFSPPILATAMAAWCAQNLPEYLSLEPSSFGHLNVITTARFKRELLRRIIAAGAEAFFSPALLLYQRRFNVNAQESDTAIAFHLPTPNWQELAAQARTSHNPDLRKLSSRFSELENPPERMMCLALLADAELSVEAFLSGYQGRENVVWYVRRFLGDSEAFVAAAGKPHQADSRFAKLAESGRVEFELRLLCFRHAVARAARGEHAELFGHCLLLMRAFYGFYNHPSLKAQLIAEAQILRESDDPDAASSIESLVEVARNAVRLVLRRQGLVVA